MVAGGERRRLLASAGAIRLRQFSGFKGARVPTNTIKAIESSAASRWVPGAWSGWNTVPAAVHQRSPSANTTPRWWFRGKYGFGLLRSLSLLHRGALGDSGQPGRGRFPVALSIHPIDRWSRRSRIHPVAQRDLEVNRALENLHLAPKPNATVGPKHLAPPDALSLQLR